MGRGQTGFTEVANPSNKGNGMTFDLEGRLVVCEHVTSSLVRMDPDGSGSGREVLASHYDGKELNSPNDVVVKSDGAIYFTDPTYGRMPGFGLEREQDLDFQGVYRIAPGGGDPQLVAGDFGQPNGLCFSVDESLLYINDTDKRPHPRLRRRGRRLAGRTGASSPTGIGTGEPRGRRPRRRHEARRARQRLGHRARAASACSTRRASTSATVEVPEPVGNLNWGGPDWNWLFIPATTSVYRMQCKVSGNRLPYMR